MGVLVVGAAVLRIAVIPAEVCPPVSPAEARTAAESTIGWFAANLDRDGSYLYGYHRGRDEIDINYNYTRHAGVMMALYQAFAVIGSSAALDTADAGLDLVLPRLLEHDGWVAWQPSGNVELGANSLLLAGLALRREATGDTTHDDLMKGIGRFLLGQQQSDGSIYLLWDVAAEAPVPVYGIFATGEASWALALLDSAFPGEGWGEAAALTADYLATERDRREGRLTRMPDHWAAYTLEALRPDLRTDLRIDYARQLAGYFGVRIRFEAQRRGDGINLLLRWVPGPPAGLGTAGEGMGALYRLAVSEPGMADQTPDIAERVVCVTGMLVRDQADAAEAALWPRPELVEGAWFYRGHTQMDGQQHVLSTLLSGIRVLESRESR